MRIFAEHPKAPRQTVKPVVSGRAHRPRDAVDSILDLQRTVGNHVVRQQLQSSGPHRRGSIALSIQRDTPRGGSAGSTTTTATPPRPLDYDRGVHRGALEVPRGVTKASITQGLNDKVKAGALKGFNVKGAPSGSDTEIFLLVLIFQLARQTNWGTESDIVSAIGWPAKQGAAPPQGLVTIRIDAQGNATAELIAAGGVPAVTQTTAAAGSARLTSDFGFASVTGWGTTSKDAAEISDVVAALELLKRRAPQDVPALKGVELIRVPALGGNTAGEFSIGGAQIQGSATVSKPFLKLADRAFDANPFQFSGGGAASPPVPASFQVILHEVGHAVEAENLRGAREAVDQASAEEAAVKKRIQDAGATYEAEFQEAKRRGKLKEFWAKRGKAQKENEDAQAKAAQKVSLETTKVKSTQVTAADIQPLKDQSTAAGTAASDALNAGKGAVQALGSDEVQKSAAYVRAIEATSAAITQFVADAAAGLGAIDDLELIVLQKVFDRDKARFDVLKATLRGPNPKSLQPLDRIAAAQDTWFEAERVSARAAQRTRRVQRFIDLVNASKIRRFTQYAVENWLLKPGEFYAEAYSLWLVDPDFVKTNYKAVYDFFQNGDYRK
jgi:hypothetical protein